ncbi:DUF4876 domain-containing protein [uncultured Chryseobacterium sp.]|jgi:Cna protein B-type domain.|uniref:DUF4876 domain-containing protein n=1 Tax=uncultured Chryseobacterium sp. TaxID=259322 RepID=UPI00260A2EC8|nr:DUF4876 domain-containing protein [uncultured Chryseobacterium sp.]
MKQFLLFFSFLLILTSCRDDDFGNNGTGGILQPVSFKVFVKYDNNYGQKISKNATVVLTNSNSGDAYTIQSDDNGIATFQNVIPGTYKVNISKKMLAAEYLDTFGYALQTDEINFNGSQEGVQVNINVPSTTVELKAAKVGDLVIKQIYYAGSSTSTGASFRDQFIEIYNNSNEVIYADGLYIAQLYGKTSTTTASYTLANGQFDWSQSMDMTMGSSANTDYVYSDFVFRIPGTGTQYPIQPGGSIVVAGNGVNHKAPLIGNNGNPINIQNPDLTVDLSNADFEAYLGDFRLSIGLTVFNTDIQNPLVPDLQIAYWGRPGYYSGGTDLLFDTQGRDSFIIFRSDNFSSYKNYADPSVTTVVSGTKFFVQIPTDVIIDGVDTQHYNPSSQRPKMLPASIDASFTSVDNMYNSQAVIRKTKLITNNRVVLEDTNNSANDFVKIKANPRGFQ